MMEEGCLSVPGVFDKAPRATNVTVRAQNEKGEFRKFLVMGSSHIACNMKLII